MIKRDSRTVCTMLGINSESRGRPQKSAGASLNQFLLIGCRDATSVSAITETSIGNGGLFHVEIGGRYRYTLTQVTQRTCAKINVSSHGRKWQSRVPGPNNVLDILIKVPLTACLAAHRNE